MQLGRKTRVGCENWVLLGYYTANTGNFLPMFRDHLTVPSSVLKNNPKKAQFSATSRRKPEITHGLGVFSTWVVSHFAYLFGHYACLICLSFHFQQIQYRLRWFHLNVHLLRTQNSCLRQQISCCKVSHIADCKLHQKQYRVFQKDLNDLNLVHFTY